MNALRPSTSCRWLGRQPCCPLEGLDTITWRPVYTVADIDLDHSLLLHCHWYNRLHISACPHFFLSSSARYAVGRHPTDDTSRCRSAEGYRCTDATDSVVTLPVTVTLTVPDKTRVKTVKSEVKTSLINH